MTTPPKPGARPSVRVDQQLSDDLATLMVEGGTVSDAVRQAVAVVAASYRYAWSTGRVPEGVKPIVGGCFLRCPTPEERRRTAADQPDRALAEAVSDDPPPAEPDRPTPDPEPSDAAAPARPTPGPGAT